MSEYVLKFIPPTFLLLVKITQNLLCQFNEHMPVYSSLHPVLSILIGLCDTPAHLEIRQLISSSVTSGVAKT